MKLSSCLSTHCKINLLEELRNLLLLEIVLLLLNLHQERLGLSLVVTDDILCLGLQLFYLSSCAAGVSWYQQAVLDQFSPGARIVLDELVYLLSSCPRV